MIKITCVYNKNSDIPLSDRLNKNFESTVYNLQIGKEYYAFAVCVSQGVLNFLIDPDDDDKPSWYSFDLFSVAVFPLPSRWQFGFYPTREKGPISAIWGYQEIVENNDHFDGLGDRVE